MYFLIFKKPYCNLKCLYARKKMQVYVLVLFLCPASASIIASLAWAMVGQGTNMEHRSSYNLNSPKVIVSRSHSGEVKNFLHSAFGNSTTIIPAGGAGEQIMLCPFHFGI